MNKKNTPLRAALYARVSDPASQDRAEDVSVDTQLADCRQLATERGYTITNEYIDRKRYRSKTGQMVDPSGERTDRPAWRALLTDIEQGQLDIIIAWKEDRLMRGVRAAVLFGDAIENSRVKVELVKDQFDPKMLYLKAAIGKMELDTLRERTAMGRRGRTKKRGLTATRTSPYFLPIRDDAGVTINYKLDPRHRKTFDRMAALYLERYSYREIARRLGINILTGRRWRAETLRNIFANPFYRGQIEYGRRAKTPNPEHFTVKGAHDPVWDEATCAGIERELIRRRQLQKHLPKNQHAPFAGLLVCGYCGETLSNTNAQFKQKNGEPYRYYTCYLGRQVRHGYRDGTPHPSNGISQPALLRALLELAPQITTDQFKTELSAALADYTAALSSPRTNQRVPAQPEPTHAQEQIQLISAQLTELRAEHDAIKSLLARQTLLAEIHRLEELLTSFQTQIVTPRPIPIPIPDITPNYNTLLKLLSIPDLLNAKEAVLRPLVQNSIPRLYVIHTRISLTPFPETQTP